MKPDSPLLPRLRGLVAVVALGGVLAGCGWVEVPASRARGMRPPVDSGGSATVAAAPAPVQVARSGAEAIPPGGAVVAQPGDTVYGLSRRYGVPMRAIIEANHLSAPYHLRVEQRVVLPAGQVHVVAGGENLHTIARRYGADPYALGRANGIGDAQTLYVGQSLHIPDSTPAPAPPVWATGTAPASGIQVAGLPPVQASPPVASAPLDVPPVSSSPASPLPPPPFPAVQPAPAAPGRDVSVTAGPSETSIASAPASVPTPPPLSGEGFLWPVRGQVIARYGPQAKGLHNDGLNIAAPRGTDVVAAQSGVVAYAGNELRGFGNLLLIKHEGGWVTAYAHNGALLVRRGDRVERGQVIARVGSSGGVSEPQLHFELRRGPQAVDPLGHLKAPIG